MSVGDGREEPAEEGVRGVEENHPARDPPCSVNGVARGDRGRARSVRNTLLVPSADL